MLPIYQVIATIGKVKGRAKREKLENKRVRTKEKRKREGQETGIISERNEKVSQRL